MNQRTKSWQEDFAQFFEGPSREGLRDLLRDHVGELDSYDFKREWPSFPKLARHILGFANSGGGCLVFGVDEQDNGSFDPTGLGSLVEKAEVHQGVEKYIPTQLEYEVLDFSYRDSEYNKLIDKSFQVLVVEDLPQYIPFVALDHGDGIRKNAIYTRRGTSTTKANYEELQEILNRRVETEYSSQKELDLDRHLSELRTLYRYIARYSGTVFQSVLTTDKLLKKNPRYPEEDLVDFVKRMIDEKKRIIEDLIAS